MSEAVPSPQDCCLPCSDDSSTSIPGTPGLPGGGGVPGTNGINAFTTLTAQLVMPAELATVVATVGTNAWSGIRQKVFLGDPAGAARGTFQISVKTGTNQITIQNLENAATGVYQDNSPAGTIFPVGTQVSPAGSQGPAGTVPGGVLLAANNLNDVALAATARTNLGLGTAALATNGLAAINLPPVGAAPLVASRSVWVNVTATGLETKDQPTALAALGVILGVANLGVPTVNLVGGLVNGQAVFATAAGIETKSAAAARTALGITALIGLSFKANKSLVQAFGGVNRVTFVELFDPDSVYTDATDRYVPGIANSIVQISCTLEAVTVGPEAGYLYIYKNGAAIAQTYRLIGAIPVMFDIVVSDLATLATDYYEVYMGSGTGISITGDITKCWFEGHRIG